MWIENISYIVTFVLSAGLSAIGILIAYQLYHQYKRPELAVMLYQQVFLFSFLIYSVWGNITLRIILDDIALNPDLSARLSVFLPMIGIPFMVVSWFMLLRFALLLNASKAFRIFPYIFFPTLVVIIFVLILLIQKKVLPIPNDADLFIIRILAGFNLLIHLLFLLTFVLAKKETNVATEIGFRKLEAVVFVTIVLISSAAMSFFNVFGFISICISIALTFAAGIYLPFIVRFQNRFSEYSKNMDFEAFCEAYEISNREAEIIIEICSGKTNKAIADKLFITLQTVKDHNHRIFTKTGVKSRVQLSNLVRQKTGKV